MAEAGEVKVKIVADNSGLKDAISDSSNDVNKFANNAMKGFAQLGASAAILGAAVKGIEFNKAAESAKVAFTVMTGSAKTAESTLKSLRDYANKTPLEFKDIRDATQTLVQFGRTAEQAVDDIKMLGDVSAGDANKLQSLSIAFGQISSAGKLMGQDLMQLINAGFNPLQEISARTGKSMADLKDDMSNGLITFDMVKEAFTDATTEGGRFFGMLDKQSQTVSGKLSTLSDAIDSSLGSITESFTPVISGFADVATSLLNGITELPAGIKAFTASLGVMGAGLLAATPILGAFGVSLSAALGPVGLIITGLIAIGTAAAVAVSALNNEDIKRATEEYGDIAETTGVAADNMKSFATATIEAEYAFQRAQGTLTDSDFEYLAESLGITADQLARIAIQSEYVNDESKELAKNYLDAGVEAKRLAVIEQERFDAQRKAYKEAEENFYRLNPQIAKAKADQEALDRLRAEELKQRQALSAAVAAINNAIDRGAVSEEDGLRRKIGLREQEIKTITEKLDRGEQLTAQEVSRIRELEGFNKDNQESLDKLLATQKEILTTTEDRAANEAKVTQAAQDQYAAFRETASVIDKEYNKAMEKQAESWKTLGDNMWGYFSQLTSAIDSLFQASTDARIDEVDRQVQAELEARGLAEETERERLERELQEAIAAGDTELANDKKIELERLKVIEAGEKKKRQLEFEGEKVSWRLKGLSMLADIAQGIAKSFTLAPPVNFINAGIVGAVGTAQLAAHAAAAPKLWTGTTNPIREPGSYIVGDQGPERVILPAGAQVMNNRDTMDSMGGGGGMIATFQVFMDSVMVAEKTANVFNNGLVRLEVS
jgi:tape measure domain-containing protein